MEELLNERPYYSDLFTMAVDPGPRINPDMLVTLRVPGNSCYHWLASHNGRKLVVVVGGRYSIPIHYTFLL